MSQIDVKYSALGGAGGFLGAATTDESASADGDGRFNRFQTGSVHWHPRTGAHEVHGAILGRWKTLGAETGALGYPMTNERTTPDGKGRYNHFQYGSIYWHPATGAHDVQRRILEAWALFGWERGFLGYPASNHSTDAAGNARVRFQSGWIGWDATTDEVRVVRCPSSTSPCFRVGVHALRASSDDGSRAANITVPQVQAWIDRADRVFEVAGVEFVYDGGLDAIPNSAVNESSGVQDATWPTVRDELNGIAQTEKKLVIAFRFGPIPPPPTPDGPTGGGYSWSDYDFVVMPGFPDTGVGGVQNIGLLAHEIGHNLGLPHTHGPAFPDADAARQHFLVKGGDPAMFDGDAATVDDTPPNPQIGSLALQFGTDSVVLGGTVFRLLRNNVMSYYHPDATLRPRTLSPKQAERVRATVVSRQARDFDVTERWGAGAEIQVYDWTYARLRAKYDELWPRGWRLHLIRPYVVGTAVRYAAVWRWGPQPEIQVYGWTYSRFRSKYDALWGDGWRLAHLEPYVTGTTVRYTAVWRPGVQPEIQVYGWTYSQFRAKYDELWPQGWRLHLLKPHAVGSAVLYSAVFRRSRAQEIQIYGATYATYRAKYDELWPLGWRLHLLEPYSVGTSVRYSAVWRRSRAPEVQLYGKALADFRTTYDDLWQSDWRLEQLAPYVRGGDVRYTGAWRVQRPDYTTFECGASTTP